MSFALRGRLCSWARQCYGGRSGLAGGESAHPARWRATFHSSLFICLEQLADVARILSTEVTLIAWGDSGTRIPCEPRRLFSRQTPA
jgi:hypothetical protein